MNRVNEPGKYWHDIWVFQAEEKIKVLEKRIQAEWFHLH